MELDPATSAALIRDQRARVEAATEADGRLLFGAWGVAWVLGFGVQWAAWPADPRIDLPWGVAMTVFGLLLVLAMVVTTVHLARRSAGVRGSSATQGAMYGWTWALAFAGIFALGAALGRAGADDVVVATVMTVSSAIVVGALYMAGGAMWGERPQFALGAWICVSATAGALVGAPGLLAVMALAGGGGMLLTALAYQVRRSRRAREARPAGPGGAGAP